MDGRYAPLFVTIYNPRRHSADIRAGANKQENDEKEGLELEVEQRGLQPELVAMKRLSVRSNYKTQGQRKDTYLLEIEIRPRATDACGGEAVFTCKRKLPDS